MTVQNPASCDVKQVLKLTSCPLTSDIWYLFHIQINLNLQTYENSKSYILKHCRKKTVQ